MYTGIGVDRKINVSKTAHNNRGKLDGASAKFHIRYFDNRQKTVRSTCYADYILTAIKPK